MTTLFHIGDELVVHIMSFIVEPKKKLTDEWEKNEELKEYIQTFPYEFWNNTYQFWNNIFYYCGDISFIEDMIKPYRGCMNSVYKNKEAVKIIKDTQENIKKKREMLYEILDNESKIKTCEEHTYVYTKQYDSRSFYIMLSMNESKEAVEIIKEEMKRYIDKNDKEGLKDFISEIYLSNLLENNHIDEEMLQILIENIDDLDYVILSSNHSPAVVKYLLHNPEKINLHWFSYNESPEAVEYLLRPENIDHIFWYHFSQNYYATEYLIENPDKIIISGFLLNTNPRAIDFIRRTPEMFGLPYSENVFKLLYNESQEAYDLFEDLVFKRCQSPSMISHKQILKNKKSDQSRALNRNDYAWKFLKENPSYTSVKYLSYNKNITSILYEPDEVETCKYIKEYLFKKTE
jgi:hypothetical protein